MSDALLDFVRLRCLTLAATPGCISGAEATRARLASFYDRARTLGLVHERVPGPDGAAIAQLMFFRDPDGLECEVCVPNPDAIPGVMNPPGTPSSRFS